MLLRKKANHDEILLPEQDAAMIQAQLTLDRIASEVAVAEGELQEAEIELRMAEDHAAEAIVADQPPVPLIRDREAVALRRDALRLLHKAHDVAQVRYDQALSQAQAQHWQAKWRQYQAAVQAFDEALGQAWQLQERARELWNAIGQPGEAPILKAPLAVWESAFHRFLQEIILDVSAEQVRRGVSLAGLHPQPRPY